MNSGTSLNEFELSNTTTTETGRSRSRKPRMTCKSPSAGDSCLIGSSALPRIARSSTPCSRHGSLFPQASSAQIKTGISSKKKGKGPTFSLLPLYHPLGRLASSLPPLDLTSVGLSTLVKSNDADFGRGHPLANLRDEGDPLLFTGSTFDDDTREKVNSNSRKRRNGAVPKRRRKDADDGDATYPTKRNRVKVVGSRNRAGDEESSTESVIHVGEITPTAEEVEEKQSERRSTRSTGPLKRRGSSTSDDALCSVPTEDAKGEVGIDETCTRRQPGHGADKEVGEQSPPIASLGVLDD